MTKQEQIDAKRVKPIEVGDTVKIKASYTTTETVTEGRGKKKVTSEVDKHNVFITTGEVSLITNTDNGLVYSISIGSVNVPYQLEKKGIVLSYISKEKHCVADAIYVFPTFNECGNNPFIKERFRVSFYNQDIVSLLFKACYGKRDNNFSAPNYNNTKDAEGTTYGGVDFNPHIIDSDGVKQFYQRELVWTLEQKQLLIDSIYNGIEIGKFLFRYKPWTSIEADIKTYGHGYSWDCVDGKQRFYAILYFVQNEFKDSHGNYFSDLSPNAQDKFLSYSNLSYGEMSETAKDSDVIDTFLTMNHSGVPMSLEHLNFVKSLRL